MARDPTKTLLSGLPLRTHRQIGGVVAFRIGDIDWNDFDNWPALACHDHFLTILSRSYELREVSSGIADGIAHKVKVLGIYARVNANPRVDRNPFPN